MNLDLMVLFWIALHMNGDNVTYFDSFGVSNILKGIKKLLRQTKIYHSIMCGYFCVGYCVTK